MKKTTLFILLLFSKFTFAQDGTLDTSFGTNGRVTFNQNSIFFNNIDSNDRIVYMNNSEIRRLNQNGSLDSTFGNAGVISTAGQSGTFRYRTLFLNDKVYAFTSVNPASFQPNYYMGRYNLDGTLDTTLGGTGYVTLDIGGIESGIHTKISNDNKILIAGNDDTASGSYDDIIVRRYSLDGVFDPVLNYNAALSGINFTSSSIGLPSTDKCSGIYETSTGKVVASGVAISWGTSSVEETQGGVVIITPDINGTNGVAVRLNSYYSPYSVKSSIFIDPNDNIYTITGKSRGNASIAAVINNIEKRNSIGTLIYSHPVSIDLTTKKADFQKIVVQPDGKILLAGVTFVNNTVSNFPELILARYLDTGVLDTSFGNGGYVLHTINSGSITHTLKEIFLSADGSVFICASDQTSSVIIKYNNPSLELKDFDTKNVIIYPNPVKDVLNLSYDQEISTIAIYNLLGQEVLTKSINANETTIDVAQLPSGTYLVKVFSMNGIKTVKISKE